MKVARLHRPEMSRLESSFTKLLDLLDFHTLLSFHPDTATSLDNRLAPKLARPLSRVQKSFVDNGMRATASGDTKIESNKRCS